MPQNLGVETEKKYLVIYLLRFPRGKKKKDFSLADIKDTQWHSGNNINFLHAFLKFS